MKLNNNHNKYNMQKSIALFMICLVLTIPLFSAKAMALPAVVNSGSINDIQYSGENGISGMLNGKSDALHLQILTSRDQGEVKTNDIIIDFNGKQVNADSCQLQDEPQNKYLCLYTSPKKAFPAKSLPLKVRLWDSSSASVLATKEATVIVDALAPVVDLQIPTGAKEMFDLKYDITDKACNDVACGNQCVGIYKLFVTANGNVVDKQDFGNETTCTYSFDEQKSAGDLSLNSGKNEICVLVSDKFGNIAGNQQKGVCKTVSIDSISPVFDQNSLVISDPTSGLPVKFRKAVAYPVNIKINVTDDQDVLQPSNVKADFSQLNPAIGSQLKSLNPNSCDPFTLDIADGKTITVSECVWNNIQLYPDLPSDSVTVTIKATDSSSNNATFTKTVTLPKDAQLPKVQKIVVLSPTNTVSNFLRDGPNNITVMIDEQGSGLFAGNVFLKIKDQDLKAERCVFNSQWICLFQNVFVTAETGNTITASVEADKSTDDVGNPFSDKNLKQQFLYDGDAPKFQKISVKPKGVDRDSLLIGQQDVVEVQANITEKGAGLNPEAVFLDTTAFDSANEGDAALLKATECSFVPTADTTASGSAAGSGDAGSADGQGLDSLVSTTDELYTCSFEYAGTIANNDIAAEVIAEDLAGNVKKSSDDNVLGKIKAVGLKTKKTDNWEDLITVKANDLNKNLLWMTQGGTLIRSEIELKKKSSHNSYVHGFKLGTCTGVLDTEISLNAKRPVPFTEVEYQTPESEVGSGKTKKLILFTLPQMDKALLAGQNNKSAIVVPKEFDITCDGAITQSSSKTSDIYTPDELFNVTVTVPFDANSVLYNPGNNGMNKLIEDQKFIDVMTDIINVIKTITGFLEKICKPANDIYQIVNDTCIIINNFAIIFGKIYPPLGNADQPCKVTSDILDKVWTGEKTPTDWNEKSVLSLGYVCDLVLCTSCSEQWSNNFLPAIGIPGSGSYTFGIPTPSSSMTAEQRQTLANTVRRPGEDPNIGTYNAGFTFDPKQSLLTALICSPPCLPTIQHKFEAMKLIAVTKQQCRKLAFVTGTSFDQCDKVMGTQICEFILGEFWYLIPNLIVQLASKWASYFVDEYLINKVLCDGNVLTEQRTLCYYKRVEVLIATALKATEIGNYIKDLKEQFGSVSSAGDDQKKTGDDINAKYEKEIGTIPQY